MSSTSGMHQGDCLSEPRTVSDQLLKRPEGRRMKIVMAPAKQTGLLEKEILEYSCLHHSETRGTALLTADALGVITYHGVAYLGVTDETLGQISSYVEVIYKR